jgi:protoporphyrinogen oxidase
MPDDKRIIILGAGPTGLGAGFRLQKLGYSNFLIVEKENVAGGLSSSFVDEQGFTWDIGGHVLFSHYRYFDELMDELMGTEWVHHERESWIWLYNRFIPYPFQNNIRFLPKEVTRECLSGLIKVATRPNGKIPENLERWIYDSFGEGIARHFLMPYNFKVWAYPPSELSHTWVGERVATVDIERAIFNILDERNDVAWGPNNRFRFPLRGGTGEIWRRLARGFTPDQLKLNRCATSLDSKNRKILFDDGSIEEFDVLISTIPLDLLIQLSDIDRLKSVLMRLRHSTIHVAGIGLRGSPPPHLQTKCWMYFPDAASPYFRVTVFSNYSPNNVPDIDKFWSLMLEVAESPAKPVDCSRVLESAISSLVSDRLIASRNDIVDVWRHTAGYGYPTPTIERDRILQTALPFLEELNIFSRGRFGGWKYEVANQDHCLMQGVEIVNRLLLGQPETTLWNPSLANRLDQPANVKPEKMLR